jgi:hypothetical protein
MGSAWPPLAFLGAGHRDRHSLRQTGEDLSVYRTGRHLDAGATLEQLAAVAHVSPYHFPRMPRAALSPGWCAAGSRRFTIPIAPVAPGAGPICQRRAG